MTSATNHLWRKPVDALGTLRDLGTVDISTTVRVDAGRDEQQTPTITMTMTPTQFRTVERILYRERLTMLHLGDLTFGGGEHVLTMELDDASNLAGFLDDDGNWSDTVTALRKALGLAGCWVELQAGP